ncbi:MAG: phage head closure protein [Holosporales bacterium]|jgi:SPP1 family predicted phage head-tail adaptor
MPSSFQEFNERITILTPSPVTDTAGGQTITYTPTGDVWAAVEILATGEAIRGGALRTDTVYRFTVHADTVLASDYRIIWRGRTLRISALAVPVPRSLYREVEGKAVDGVG